jgi:hypothetical protein
MDTQNIIYLTNLRDLMTWGTDLPPSISPLSRLVDLVFDDYADMYSIPPDITCLTKLTGLRLYQSQFQEDIVPALSALTQLREAYVGLLFTHVAYQFNALLSDATSITKLQIRAQFQEAQQRPLFPAAVTTLCSLRELGIEICSSNPVWPTNMTSLNRVTSLTLTSSLTVSDGLDFAVPDFVFGLTTLQRLQLDTDDLSRPRATLPEQISRLQQLRVLQLPEHVELCEQVTGLRRLERIDVVFKRHWANDRSVKTVRALTRRSMRLLFPREEE